MQVLSGSGVVAVVRGDPALLPLEKVERDRPGVVGLEQLLRWVLRDARSASSVALSAIISSYLA